MILRRFRRETFLSGLIVGRKGFGGSGSFPALAKASARGKGALVRIIPTPSRPIPSCFHPRWALAAWLSLGAVSGAAQAAGTLESLGVFSDWAAFRDSSAGVCHAKTATDSWRGTATVRPYLAVTYAPKQGVRGQLYARLSRAKREEASVTLTVGSSIFPLTGSANHAWGKDGADDAKILSALRTGTTATVSSMGSDGVPIRETYQLGGAATAIDAAALGCVRSK